MKQHIPERIAAIITYSSLKRGPQRPSYQSRFLHNFLRLVAGKSLRLDLSLEF